MVRPLGLMTWFRTTGLSSPAVPRGPTIGDDATLLQAAIDGPGAAPCPSRTVWPKLVWWRGSDHLLGTVPTVTRSESLGVRRLC